MAEEPTVVRKKRIRPKYPPHWLIIPLLVLAPCAWFGWRLFGPGSDQGPFVLPGYITSKAVFEREAQHFYGKAFSSPDAEEKFLMAAESMSNHDLGGALTLLEEASKQVAIPVIFNDLGVLFAKLDRAPLAVNAFREVLARDEAYIPARQNLKRLKGLPSVETAYPVTREMEPNDVPDKANLISIGKPVAAKIGENPNDVDWYRVNSPVPPRDHMEIQVTCKSKSLALILDAYDENMGAFGTSARSPEPGACFTAVLSPPPNATVYIKVAGIGGATGPYSLLVRAQKAFDAFEPNDMMFSAATISLGQTIEANIMDGHDTDFYSFVSPRTGTVTIDLENRAPSLILTLSTHLPNERESGSAPEVTNPGEGLRHTMEVRAGETYHLEIASQADTFGKYTLTVQ
jgi:hypothetical protein